MTLRHYYQEIGGSDVEMTEKVLRVGWEARENAEEGATAIWTIDVFDPDLSLDFSGFRRWLMVEDSSTATDTVIASGHVADQVISRGESDTFEPLGRVWTLSIADDNNRWMRRVMLGSDCNRPAETDVARMQWLLATSEVEYGTYLTDVTTYVSTASPVSMDKADYRGQLVQQVVDDCAQASGKNWWIQTIYDGADYNPTAWYGKGSLSAYSSPLSLSNDPADWTDAALLDGSSLVWPYSEDTQLRRDPSRVYAGIYLPYDGGAVYRKRAATATNFTLRDGIMPSINVKSASKASARAIRYLDDLATQDERITTRVRLPKAIATKIRAGMRLQFKGVHLPGYEGFQWVRVLSCSPKPVAAGGYYDLSLELEGNPGEPPATCNIAAITTGEVNDQASGVSTANATISVSVSVSPSSASSHVIVGAAIDHRSAAEYSDSMTFGTTLMMQGYTTSHHPDGAVGYKTGVTTTSPTAISGSYSSGTGGSEHWAACALAFPSSASAPVQAAGAFFNVGDTKLVTLSPVTAGNLLVMAAWIRDSPSPQDAPPGWTRMASAFTTQHPISGTVYDQVVLYARCVTSDDSGTTDWGWGLLGREMAFHVSEWTIS